MEPVPGFVTEAAGALAIGFGLGATEGALLFDGKADVLFKGVAEGESEAGCFFAIGKTTAGLD